MIERSSRAALLFVDGDLFLFKSDTDAMAASAGDAEAAVAAAAAVTSHFQEATVDVNLLLHNF